MSWRRDPTGRSVVRRRILLMAPGMKENSAERTEYRSSSCSLGRTAGELRWAEMGHESSPEVLLVLELSELHQLWPDPPAQPSLRAL
jgi:hypothetical protein